MKTCTRSGRNSLTAGEKSSEGLSRRDLSRLTACLLFIFAYGCVSTPPKRQFPVDGSSILHSVPRPAEPEAVSPAPTAQLESREKTNAPRISAGAIMETIRRLASEDYGGRKFGSTGGYKISLWLANKLEQAMVEGVPLGILNKFPLPGCDVTTRGETTAARFLAFRHGSRGGRDVIAWIPPLNVSVSDLPTDDFGGLPPFVMISAHFDGEGRIAGTLYPGADDNASGTAVVLEMARYFKLHPLERLGVLLLFTDGEEAGLLGMRAFTKCESSLLRKKCVIAVNVDMVGRKLVDFGGRSGLYASAVFCVLTSGAEKLEDELIKTAPPMPVIVVSGENFFYRFLFNHRFGFGHDGMILEELGVPMLFISNGVHPQYSTPNDTPDRIEPKLAAARAEMIIRFLRMVDEKYDAAVAAEGDAAGKTGNDVRNQE